MRWFGAPSTNASWSSHKPSFDIASGGGFSKAIDFTNRGYEPIALDRKLRNAFDTTSSIVVVLIVADDDVAMLAFPLIVTLE